MEAHLKVFIQTGFDYPPNTIGVFYAKEILFLY